MKVLLQGPIRGLRGHTKNSGLVYFLAHNAQFARAHVIPNQPNSPNQLLIRAIVSNATARFSTVLTEAQALAWKAFGQTYYQLSLQDESFTGHLSALQAYVKVNVVRRILDMAFLDAGPSLPPPPVPESMSFVLAEEPDSIQFTVDHFIAAPYTNYKLLVKLTPPIADGRNVIPTFTKLQLIKGVNSGSGTVLIDPATPYLFTGLRTPYIAGDKGIVAAEVINPEGTPSAQVAAFFTWQSQ